jgi:hypothetical protein
MPTLSFPGLRGDFPDEIGALAVLQQKVAAAGDDPTVRLLSLLPRSLPREDYARLAAWIRLPERVAYAEGVRPGGTTIELAVAPVPPFKFFVPVSPLWFSLVAELRRHLTAGPGPLPCQLSAPPAPAPGNAFAPQWIVHDRVAGRFALVPTAEMPKYLCRALRWEVPRDGRRPADPVAA